MCDAPDSLKYHNEKNHEYYGTNHEFLLINVSKLSRFLKNEQCLGIETHYYCWFEIPACQISIVLSWMFVIFT